MNELVCGGELCKAQLSCIRGTCIACGFSKLWSKGLRPLVLDEKGEIRGSAPPVWGELIRWERLRAGMGTSEPQEQVCAVRFEHPPPHPVPYPRLSVSIDAHHAQVLTDDDGGRDKEGKETLKETVRGTLIELLDEVEMHVAQQAVQHRFDRYMTGLVAKLCHQNFWPRWLKSDYDYPENGEILDPKQIQSDYWRRVYYSLFMSITSFLVLKVLCRSSITLHATAHMPRLLPPPPILC